MLGCGATTPQDYPEWSGFGRRTERECGSPAAAAAGSIRRTHPCASTSSGRYRHRSLARRTRRRQRHRASRSACRDRRRRRETQLTAVLATEGNVRRSGQVDLVPFVHHGDPPSPGKGPGEARRASRHVAPIGFGSGPDRMRLPQRSTPNRRRGQRARPASTLKSTCGDRCRLSRN